MQWNSFLSLYAYTCRYINKFFDSIQNWKRILHANVLGGCFAFNVKAFGCCSRVKCRDRSWISLSIWAAREAVPVLRVSLCPWQVDVTAQVGVARTWATLLVMSSRSVLICGCLGWPSPIPLQLASLQHRWSLVWRCFCCGCTCMISFCDYKCISCWNSFRSGLQAVP